MQRLRTLLDQLVHKETTEDQRRLAEEFRATDATPGGMRAAPRAKTVVDATELPNPLAWPRGAEAILLTEWWALREERLVATLNWTLRELSDGAYVDWASIGDGEWASLADLGYARVGIDDGWQLCHAGRDGATALLPTLHSAGWILIALHEIPSLA